MNRLNPEKFTKEIETAIALIDDDPSREGSTSNIIDRAARSMFTLLRIIVDNSTEDVTTDEIKELKNKILRMEVEITRLKKKINLL